METVLLDLLRQPTAIVELGIAILAFVYMAQLVIGNRRSDSIRGGVSNTVGSRINYDGINYDRVFVKSPARGNITYFCRMLHADVSDRGAIFPKGPEHSKSHETDSRNRRESRHFRLMEREAALKLYGVGTYLSSKKQSLKRPSANRMRLPI